MDLGIKSSVFPTDLKDLFQHAGVWRENLTVRPGAFLPIDQIHEQAYNLPLKSAISANRQTEQNPHHPHPPG